jgi:hypothetical protein
MRHLPQISLPGSMTVRACGKGYGDSQINAELQWNNIKLSSQMVLPLQILVTSVRFSANSWCRPYQNHTQRTRLSCMLQHGAFTVALTARLKI